MIAPGRFSLEALCFPVWLSSPQFGVVGCTSHRSCPTSRGCASLRSPPPMRGSPSTSTPHVGQRPAPRVGGGRAESTVATTARLSTCPGAARRSGSACACADSSARSRPAPSASSPSRCRTWWTATGDGPTGSAPRSSRSAWRSAGPPVPAWRSPSGSPSDGAPRPHPRRAVARQRAARDCRCGRVRVASWSALRHHHR